MKIYFSILNEGWINDELTIKLPRWLDEVRNKHIVYFESSKLKPIENNRNTIVKRFLESDFDYLLQIDCDIVPEQNPLTLVELDKDIMVCPCPIYQETKIWNCYRLDEEKYWRPIELENEKEKIIAVDAVGTGCILIKRKVLETIKAPFERIFDEDGIEKLGLDLSFSKKVKETGYKIYVSVDYKCSHFKNIDLQLLK